MEIYKSEVKFGRKFLDKTLRNTGYDQYTAIADIIDNSLETNVDSKNVRVYINKTGNSKYGCLKTIEIADDGSGMNLPTLKEAVKFGSETGKTLEDNYGCYGAGLKTAGLSFGRCITVITKMEGDLIYRAVLDLDSNPGEPLPQTVIDRIEEGSDDANMFYGKIKADHGTLVIISKIDRGQSNVDQFRQNLKTKLRIIFNKFIESGKTNFYLYSERTSEKLEFFDTLGTKSGLGTFLVAEKDFRIKGANVGIRVYNVPSDGGHVNQHTGVKEDFFPRTSKNSGFYIYRKNRLVGGLNQGLDLGIIQRSGGYTTGLRVELYVDGKADSLLGCTFNKMVTEKDLNGIDKDLHYRISEVVQPIVRAEIRRSKKSEAEKVLTEREQVIQKAFETATASLNGNAGIKAGLIQKGRNLHSGNSKPRNPNPKKQLHPNPHRNRTGAWTGGFRTVNEGSDGNHVTFSFQDRRITTLLNADHPYFQHLAKQSGSALVAECLQIGGRAAALQKVGYFDDEEKRQVIDEYLAAVSQAMRSLYDRHEEE